MPAKSSSRNAARVDEVANGSGHVVSRTTVGGDDQTGCGWIDRTINSSGIAAEGEEQAGFSDSDLQQVAILGNGRKLDRLRTNDRLWHNRRHKRAKVETNVETRRTHLLAGDRAELTTNRHAVHVVHEVFREPQHDLVLVGRITDGNAARCDGDVGVGASVAERIADATGASDGDIAQRGGIDHRAGAKPQRELLWALVEFSRSAVHAFDVEGNSAVGKRSDEVEGEHFSLLKPFGISRSRLTTHLWPPPAATRSES